MPKILVISADICYQIYKRQKKKSNPNKLSSNFKLNVDILHTSTPASLPSLCGPSRKYSQPINPTRYRAQRSACSSNKNEISEYTTGVLCITICQQLYIYIRCDTKPERFCCSHSIRKKRQETLVFLARSPRTAFQHLRKIIFAVNLVSAYIIRHKLHTTSSPGSAWKVSLGTRPCVAIIILIMKIYN